MASRNEIIRYLDDRYDIGSFRDYSNNGLQVEGREECNVIGAAVDAGSAVIERAIERKVDLLLVHHGVFWGKAVPVVGAFRNKLKLLFDSGMSLYAIHLPLDAHPEDGNNVLLANALGLRSVQLAFPHEGRDIGLIADNPGGKSIEELNDTCRQFAGSGPVLTLPFGPKIPQRIAVVTGAGADAIFRASEYSFDTLVTGEPKQAAYHYAQEHGLNLIAAGHYATETFGVRRVVERVQEAFGVTTVFVDHPTGI